MTTYTVSRVSFTATVQADDAEGAILAMVRDAGYETIADAADVLGESEQDFIDAQIVEEVAEDDDADGSFRACYFVTADGQGDVLLTGEDEADLSDDDLIEAAIAVARDCGLIGHTVRVEYDHETGEDVEICATEQDVLDGLRIGEYRL